MASTQKAAIFHLVKTNKTGSKAHRGAEVISSVPQRGHGHISSSGLRNVAVPLSPSSQRRNEAAFPTTPHSASDYPQSMSPQSGPGSYITSIPRGSETRPRTEAPRHFSPHRKNQSIQTLPSHASVHRNASPVREDATRRSSESKPGRECGYRSLPTSDAKCPRHLSFIDENLEEDPPSKVQNPQGVRVHRKVSVHPKDEAIQTEPTRRTASDLKSPRGPCSTENGNRVPADYQTVHRKIPGQEVEVGHHSSILSEPKSINRNMKMSSAFKVSVLRESAGGNRVPSPRRDSVHSEIKSPLNVLVAESESNVKLLTRDPEVGRKVTIYPARQSTQSTHHVTTQAVSEVPRKSSMYPELSQKTSIHAEMELTPRPLPPRSLPRYGPDCSWWALLNPEVEMPPTRPTSPDFEPNLNPLQSFLEMNSSHFFEDLMFPKEKAGLPPSPKESSSRVPVKEVPQSPKNTSKQPIQGFNAFFLDVSEEMYNRIIWWLKGLCWGL
uniref:Uncharacterized protein n=1 Tax=Jaculus jaculus TaxID=51337 RepID=A0A8C5L7B9_JACJA